MHKFIPSLQHLLFPNIFSHHTRQISGWRLFKPCCVTFVTAALAASSWDDFANNLATDLTPILQLFGEQVTKEYLVESISTLDCIIFAMAPLGILTVIVSVIQVCGDSILKAFVGRAQEGSGVAELELCSSIGRDIVELYQGGAITRVFGRGKILEIVHDPTLEQAISEEDATATRGIYTFMRYQKEHANGNNWVPSSWPKDMDPSGKSRREQREEITERLGYAKNPNLMLNIGLRRHPRWLLVSIAIFATLLQSSMLGFAGWVTFVKKLQKEDAMSPSWALSMTIIGTSSLCAGMLMCSSLIERSTKECTFSRSNLSNDTSSSSSHTSDEETGIHNEGPGGHSTDMAQTTGSVDRKPRTAFYWVQPGDQVIGDQTFDSFAYSDKAMPLPSYTISWRGPSSPWERKMTWLASMLTIIAFIVQFIGLRGLHSSVQVYQLAVVLIMSVLRALLRTKRLDPSDNLFNITENLGNMDKNMSEDINMTINLRGHELDLLAFDIYRDRTGGNVLATGSGHLNNTWILKCSDANNRETKEQHLTHEGLERIPGTSVWRPKDSNEHRLWPWEEKDTSIQLQFGAIELVSVSSLRILQRKICRKCGQILW
jgi:TRAP-type C4-dicarboxylate transport system permease small subunit